MSLSRRSGHESAHTPNGKPMVWLAIGVAAVGLLVGLDRDLAAAPETGNTPLLIRVDELSRTVDALTTRVAALEAEAAKREADGAQGNQRVTAPFEVVDKSGKVILSVSDGTYGDATTRGRVHIGRGTGDNYGLWIRGADGAGAVVLREQASGAGGVFVMDKKGTPLRGRMIAGSVCFMLTDHLPMPKNSLKGLERLGADKTSLGPKMLFASQCVLLIHNELDQVKSQA